MLAIKKSFLEINQRQKKYILSPIKKSTLISLSSLNKNILKIYCFQSKVKKDFFSLVTSTQWVGEWEGRGYPYVPGDRIWCSGSFCGVIIAKKCYFVWENILGAWNKLIDLGSGKNTVPKKLKLWIRQHPSPKCWWFFF